MAFSALGTAIPGIAEPAERMRWPAAVSEDTGGWFRFDAEDVVRVVGWDGWLADLIDQETADKVGKVWGLGSDTPKDPGPWEGEQRNMCN